MAAVIRCAKSIDGTPATATEVYVDGRLFVSADSLDAASRSAPSETVMEWAWRLYCLVVDEDAPNSSRGEWRDALARVGPPPTDEGLLLAVAEAVRTECATQAMKFDASVLFASGLGACVDLPAIIARVLADRGER